MRLVENYINPLRPGGNIKVTHTYTNLQLKAAVCVTFLLTPGIKWLIKLEKD